MIFVADFNTAWRSKPFEALSRFMPVTGICPYNRFVKPKHLKAGKGVNVVDIPVLPGWATWFNYHTTAAIFRNIKSPTKLNNNRLLVVTIPHYLPLAKMCRKEQIPVIYYCSDDYSQYKGWNPTLTLKKEMELLRICSLNIFVSQSLAQERLKITGIPADRILISPNATDAPFLVKQSKEDIDKLLQLHPSIKRPIVGVVGTFNKRVDFKLLQACASLPEVGTLLLIGSWDPDLDENLIHSLTKHPKCLAIGHQPHDILPGWMQALDVALIPYQKSIFNLNCSPMRLYDHMASGVPIVSTDACDQIKQFAHLIHIGTKHEEVLKHVSNILSMNLCIKSKDLLEEATKHTWEQRAKKLADCLKFYY